MELAREWGLSNISKIITRVILGGANILDINFWDTLSRVIGAAVLEGRGLLFCGFKSCLHGRVITRVNLRSLRINLFEPVNLSTLLFVWLVVIL